MNFSCTYCYYPDSAALVPANSLLLLLYLLSNLQEDIDQAPEETRGEDIILYYEYNKPSTVIVLMFLVSVYIFSLNKDMLD